MILIIPGKEFIKKTDEFLCRALSGELGEAADVSKENTERREISVLTRSLSYAN